MTAVDVTFTETVTRTLTFEINFGVGAVLETQAYSTEDIHELLDAQGCWDQPKPEDWLRGDIENRDIDEFEIKGVPEVVTSLVCHNCGNEEIHAQQKAYLNQIVRLGTGDVLDYEPWGTEDFDLDGQEWYVCRRCGEHSESINHFIRKEKVG